MPPARGFTERELERNPRQKAQFACAARCSPICSLRWFINSIALEPTTTMALNANSVPQQIGPESSGARPPLVGFRRIEPLSQPAAAHSSDGRPSGDEYSLVQLETIWRPTNESTSGRWQSESLISAEPPSLAREDSEPGALKRQLELSSPVRVERANVLSKLELSYNQIAALLIGDPSNNLTVGCKLIAAGSHWALEHTLIKPNDWFPGNVDSGTTKWHEQPRIASIEERDSTRRRFFGLNDRESSARLDLETRIHLESK